MGAWHLQHFCEGLGGAVRGAYHVRCEAAALSARAQRAQHPGPCAGSRLQMKEDVRSSHCMKTPLPAGGAAQVGGSSALGTWGYVQACEEMRQQTMGMGVTDIAMVSAACDGAGVLRCGRGAAAPLMGRFRMEGKQRGRGWDGWPGVQACFQVLR